MKSKKTILVIVLLALCLAATVACKPVGGGTLASPTITLEGNVVSWQAVENATGYSVKVGSDAAVSVTTTSYTVSKTAAGSYKITVTAVSSDEKWKESAPSNEVTYVVEDGGSEKTALTAPVITLSGNTVSWQAVPNAVSYDVKVGSAAAVNVTATSYTLTQTEAGSYDVTVVAKAGASETYKDSAPSNKVTYTVEQSADAVLTEIDVDPVGVPSTVYLDQGITELDLSQIVVTAYYDNDTEKEIALTDVTIGEYDLTTVGRKVITVTYSENGVTADPFEIRVEVAERGIDDIDEYDTLLLEYSDAGKYTIEGAAAIRNMKGENMLQDGQVTLPQGKTLLAVDDKFVVVTVAKFVSDKDSFLAIADDMDGYYVLTKDIDLGGVWHAGPYIGAAPLMADTNLLDYENGVGQATVGDGAAGKGQLGVAFTGTLDGQGYAIYNAKISCSEAYNGHLARGNALFGYLGTAGVIQNVTLRNIRIDSGKYNSFLVGYNKGTIKNICIEADCVMNSQYSGGYLVAGYNDGTVTNVVSYVAQYKGFNSAMGDFAVSNNSLVDESTSVLHGTSSNGYVADKTDLTATLGDGWRYFDGFGTVLANDDYVIITTDQRELAIGGKLYLNVLFVNGDAIDFAAYGSKSDELTVLWDSTLGTHYVAFKDVSSTTLVAGDKVTINVYSTNWKVSCSIEITVTAAVPTDYEALTETLNVVEGTDIDLTKIDITEKYTDGTTKTIHPVRVADFDKNGTVGAVQTVKAFYGEGEDDYVEISVMLIAKSVESIAIDTASSYKNVYNVGDELDLAGLKIAVTYNNGTNESIAVTSGMLSEYDISTAGSKQITITHGGKTCILNVTVNEVGVEVTSISVAGTPAKTTYKLNEEVTLENLAGATVTASNSNGTTTENIPITLAMISYEFNAVGAANITVTYEGKTATIAVTVADYATALNVTATETTLRYNAETTLDLVANATYSLTMASGATKAVTSGITASEYKAGLNTITYTYTDEYATVTATQQYEIWYEINSKDGWEAMKNNFAGYYVMTGDIDFYNGYISPIGQAPIKQGADGCAIDFDEADGDLLAAVPFTGKLDGGGYVLKKATINYGDYAAYNENAFCKALFGYVGEGAEVKNVTLREIKIRAGQYGAFIAGYNKGLIENICIESSCTLYSNYGIAGVIAGHSFGTINNVVSYVTVFGKVNDATTDDLVNMAQAEAPRVSDCYIGNTTDLTAVENSTFTYDEETKTGWKYFENLGTVYVNSDYVYIRQTAVDLPENGRLYLNLAFVEDKNFIMQEWSDSEFEMLWDGEVGSHYLVVKSVGTEKNNIEINIRNGSWKGNHAIYINITEAKEDL